MTINFAIAAQLAHPTVSNILHETIPSEAVSKLDRIGQGEPVTKVYAGETRDWWDLVDPAQIEEVISDPLFEGYVRLMTAIAD